MHFLRQPKEKTNIHLWILLKSQAKMKPQIKKENHKKFKKALENREKILSERENLLLLNSVNYKD